MADRTRAADELRALVIPPRVSQEAVAKACKVSQQAVSGWMHGRTKPTVDRMRILQDQFGIPMEHWAEPGTVDSDGGAAA